MKPWDLILSGGNKLNDSFNIPLWDSFRPKDFYFATQFSAEDNACLVYIVPREYYDEHGIMFDDSMPIVKFLPQYLVEIIECVYEASNVKQVVVASDMLATGFKANPFFQKYIDDSNGILGP